MGSGLTGTTNESSTRERSLTNRRSRRHEAHTTAPIVKSSLQVGNEPKPPTRRRQNIPNPQGQASKHTQSQVRLRHQEDIRQNKNTTSQVSEGTSLSDWEHPDTIVTPVRSAEVMNPLNIPGLGLRCNSDIINLSKCCNRTTSVIKTGFPRYPLNNWACRTRKTLLDKNKQKKENT